MIRLDQVSKEYADGVVAVNNVSLEVATGQTLCLIGTTGCGKTTTLKLINRLLTPSRGQIIIDGQDAAALDAITLRRRIGYVIQKIGLLPHYTVAENVALLPRLEGWAKERTDQRVHELLSLVGLDPDEHGRRYPTALSGGEQQRVGVARALALDPPVILMDEPFGALDPITRETLQDEFLHLRQAFQKTVVMVTHDLNEAFKLGNLIALMHNGQLMAVASPVQILRWPPDTFVGFFVRKHLAKLSLDVLPASDAVDKVQEAQPEDVTLSQDASLRHVLELFIQQPKAQRVSLIDDGGRSHGVITRDSLLAILS